MKIHITEKIGILLAQFNSYFKSIRALAMRNFVYSTILIISFLATTTSSVAGDPDTGKIKADTCLGCHGIAGYTNVYPTYHVPRLGGQYADYIILALKAYQSGERSHPTMRAQAAGLSEEDMADIGAYFESLQ